tara:strand:+ start:689 stop:958 length:270 start_codon:yes stop_codon:yes gene_type:complete
MGLEATIHIDTRDFRNDGNFCDIVSDIAADTIRDSGEVEHIVTTALENDIDYYIQQHIEENSVLNPNDDAFINAVAKAILNMARSYVGE